MNSINILKVQQLAKNIIKVAQVKSQKMHHIEYINLITITILKSNSLKKLMHICSFKL